MDGENCWKRQTSSDLNFYDFAEVTDGYFMLGKVDSELYIVKFNLQGEDAKPFRPCIIYVLPHTICVICLAHVIKFVNT